ncbi:hypothetical protein AAG906_021549 [Vitis piasezkii]
MLPREPMKERYLRRNSLESVPLHDAVSAPQDAGDEEASAGSDTNCFELNKPTTSNFKPHGDFRQWKKTMMESFQLHADSLDDSMSGITAIVVLVRGWTIYVANSGIRAIIAERKGKEIVVVDSAIDQTPFRAYEFERVKLCGARVLTLDQIKGLKNPVV